jgi:outer membrane immunogenic protein
MKLALFVVVVTSALTVPASASDQVASIYDWSGGYLGASIGYAGGEANNDWYNTTVPAWEADGDIEFKSLVGGGYAGFQSQFGSVVLGLEADFNFADMKGDDAQVAGVINGIEINGTGSARARAGWAIDRTLLYATGGAAIARYVKADISLSGDRDRRNIVGWTVGVGAEHAFSENWVGRVGYNYTDFGSVNSFLTDASGSGYQHRANDIKLHGAQVGIGFKF